MFRRVPTEQRNCSALHQPPVPHLEPDHSLPEYSSPESDHSPPQRSEQVWFAGLMPAVNPRLQHRCPTAEKARPAVLRRLSCRRARQKLASPVNKAERALPQERCPYQELRTTKKQLDASTHQSYGQYPSLCAIQQRGSFRSPNRWVCFQDKTPQLASSSQLPYTGSHFNARTILTVRRNCQPRGHNDFLISCSCLPRAA